jgi:hypothetical protein
VNIPITGHPKKQGTMVWQQPSGGPNVVTNAAVAKIGGINI